MLHLARSSAETPLEQCVSCTSTSRSPSQWKIPLVGALCTRAHPRSTLHSNDINLNTSSTRPPSWAPGVGFYSKYLVFIREWITPLHSFMTTPFPGCRTIQANTNNPTPITNLSGYCELNYTQRDLCFFIVDGSSVPIYEDVRSLAAESDRAFQGGPLEYTFYHEASLIPEEGGDTGFKVPNQYSRRLDWFAVDLEEEHSAMDGQIVEEQTEYVIYAIHRILDQYKESFDTRSREGAETTGSLPKSVILVGHSMGGFVARAAVVHPYLRKAAVETILTLSSPHQSPPVALQPSLGRYYSLVNQEWRKGYEAQLTHTGHLMSEPTLSHVVVVSVSGGVHDYQVRPKMESLDGIVPPSHGFMIGSTSMRNVWLSMEHQAILWCNQLVVQVSHTLLSLIDSESGHPYPSANRRLSVFTKMLQSGITQCVKVMRQVQSSKSATQVHVDVGKNAEGSKVQVFSPCPHSTHWNDDALEKDLYIQGNTVTVLAMDGRRRWLDIQKMRSDGKSHFIFVTNLAPCSGVRLHLWPEKGKTLEVSPNKRTLEVTTKMVQIPARPAPMQIEPGSQTEQAPPSSMFQLGPEDMHGFRFLTISVAPRLTVSGRPPPAASMAVGQFFSPEEGRTSFSAGSMLLSSYVQQEILFNEDHSLLLNLSFSVSLGLLPVMLSVKTTGCGIKSSGLPIEEAGDVQHSRLCKLRCFPPVAVAWDSTAGLQIVPNLYSETIVVDSSPAFQDSTQESDITTVLLLVDPHCSIKISASVSVTAAAGRFLLLYSSQIVGFSIAVIFFALMRQARAWELDLSLPSLMACIESNLRMPMSFLLLAVAPIFVSLFISMLNSWPLPPFMSFFMVSLLCYAFANGCVIVLILTSQLVFYLTASSHTFIKIRWQVWEESFHFTFLRQFLSSVSTFKALRILEGNPTLATAVVSIILVCFIHPVVGLLILLLSHALYCHIALCSFLAASFRSHAQRKELFDSKSSDDEKPRNSKFKFASGNKPLRSLEENTPNSPNCRRSYSDAQIEIFHHRHGLLILHLFAVVMFVPSFMAWIQRNGFGRNFPWLLDSSISVGIILHGLCCSKPESNFLSIPLPCIRAGTEVGMSFVYLLAGVYCYLSGLAQAPYRAFYAIAIIGVISSLLKILERRNRLKGETYFSANRKHSHRH